MIEEQQIPNVQNDESIPAFDESSDEQAEQENSPSCIDELEDLSLLDDSAVTVESEVAAQDCSDNDNDDEHDDNDDQPPVEVTIVSVIEAVLFATDEPITPQKLVEITGAGGVKDVKDQIDQLNEKYEQMNCAFRIEAIAGGYQMLTQPAYNIWLKKLIKVRSETKLSPAALETLAIIAYKQPILRVDIEAVRGVAAGEMVRQLIEKGLVKIIGRAEVLGRPLLYGTTRKFLQTFGLNSLKDLPSNEDLKKPD